jgi:hypothetical protein
LQYTNVNTSKRMKHTLVEADVRDHQQTRTAPARVLAGLLVPTALAVTSAVLVWAASAPIAAVRAPGPAPVDALLALGAALLCAALLALAAVGATLSLAALLTGQVAGRLGRLAVLLTPRVVRAAVCVALGVTVIAGPLAGASTASVTAPVTQTAASSVQEPPKRPLRTQQLPPGWSPDRPATGDPGTREPAQRRARVAPDARISDEPSGTHRSDTTDRAGVVVLRGDTLWAIAERHLGPGASDAQVAAEWPRWHAANRSTIGADPDLLLPGQRLSAPPRQLHSARTTTARTTTAREESP